MTLDDPGFKQVLIEDRQSHAAWDEAVLSLNGENAPGVTNDTTWGQAMAVWSVLSSVGYSTTELLGCP